jgi:glutamate/tyrosine decarboxylase-like PLP-dependent enzyme
MQREVQQLHKKFQQEIPRHSPRYMAHMFSDYSIPALSGHFLGLLYNPNNISTESSIVGSKIETSAIFELSKMIGYPKTSTGHFTSGGTIANIEMLYRFKKLAHDKSNYCIFLPKTAHYSWQKGFDLLGIPNKCIKYIDTDANGAANVLDLEKQLMSKSKMGIKYFAVVSILGNTEFGAIDPINKISRLIKYYKKKYTVWHHIDAAYGGFYCTLKRSKNIDANFLKNLIAVKTSDSITIDPHKLGYVPYASGCFICKNKQRYRVVQTGAAYVDFKSKKQSGLYTIEGSRTAAGAIATLLSAKTIGFNYAGLGKIIEKTLADAKLIKDKLRKNSKIHILEVENSNILCFFVASKENSLSKSNFLTQKLHKKISTDCSKSSNHRFFVSKTLLSKKYANMINDVCLKNNIKDDSDELFLIRCTIMNPFTNSKYYKNSIIDEFVSYINLCI